ncbi:hypothetical protein QQF64_031547 [Cirrhinus molitorella]|uniref:Uncharacterized protein n=1 Tax=Cirrhinus molitorella TaxID=172907 RepID=A0ABR3MX94_9TELE
MPGSTWEEGHQRQAPFTPSTTSENMNKTKERWREKRRRGQETNMKMCQKDLVKTSNATVDKPPLCVYGGERIVE